MINKITKKVQDKIEKLLPSDVQALVGQKAIVIFDTYYEIITINKASDLFVVDKKDERGRVKDNTSVLLFEDVANVGWERVDLAFVGDTLKIDGKDRVVKEIKKYGVKFEDGEIISLPLTENEKASGGYSDYLVDIITNPNTTPKDEQEQESKSESSETEIKKRVRYLQIKEIFGGEHQFLIGKRITSIEDLIFILRSIALTVKQNRDAIILRINSNEGKDITIFFGKDATSGTDSSEFFFTEADGKNKIEEILYTHWRNYLNEFNWKPIFDSESEETKGDRETNAEPEKEMTIKEKIESLGMIPLFPDTNFFYKKDPSIDRMSIDSFGIIIVCHRNIPDIELVINMSLVESDLECSFFGSVVKSSTKEVLFVLNENKFIKFSNLPDVLNKFNSFYEIIAKKFNEILMDSIKEELKKEKEKQKEKEKKEQQEKQDKAEEEGEKGEGEKGEGEKGEGEKGEGEKGEGEKGEGEKGEGEKGEGEKGEGEKGEGEKGEGEKGEGEKGEGEQGEGEQREGEQGEGEQGEGEQGEGEQGEGEQGGKGNQGEMSSDDIQKLIDELSKDDSEGQEGQSSNQSKDIDLEDFLDQVEKGNADNDFSRNYNDKDLKDKINEEKEKQESGEKPQSEKQAEQEQKYQLKNVVQNISEMLSTDVNDMKRRFPSPASIVDFVDSLTTASIVELADKVGLPKELTNIEKRKQIASSLITEIQNT